MRSGAPAFFRRFRHLTYTFGEASNALTLLTIAVMARHLDTATFGVAVAVMATGGILSELSEFGFPSLLNRTVAQQPDSGWSLTRSALARQIALMAPMLAVFAVYLHLAHTPAALRAPAFLIGASLAFRSLKGTLRATCRARQMFDTEAFFLWTERGLIFLLAATALFTGRGFAGVAAAFAGVRAVDFLVFAWTVRRRLGPDTAAGAPAKAAYGAAFPFAIGALMWSLYYQVDATMLSLLSTPHDTGVYGAVYRFLDVFQVLPRVMVAVGYPLLVTAWITDRNLYLTQLRKLKRRLNAAAVPLLIVAAIAAPWLLQVAFGPAFREGATALRAILVGVFFSCQSIIYANALTSAGFERRVAASLTLTVFVNVGLNSALIPRYGYLGAAVATAITEAIYAVTLTTQARRLGLYARPERPTRPPEGVTEPVPVTQPPAAEG
jgi:O-antigen/teichoic acid export membrane protein